MMTALTVRLGPPGAGASRRSLRVLEHDLLVFRRGWYSYLVSALAQPFLYLVAMGIGLGLYVNRNGGLPGGVPYLNYIAPALLVTQAMMAAASESAWPILGKIMWDRTYVAALNTPLAAADLLVGDLMWIAFRSTLLAVLFLAAIGVLGAASSPMVMLAVPVAVLTAIAFAAPIMAFTATQRSDGSFNALFRFGITPLFLFSGTFFPIDVAGPARAGALAHPHRRPGGFCRGGRDCRPDHLQAQAGGLGGPTRGIQAARPASPCPAGRAEPAGLSADLHGHLLRVLRAALLPLLDGLRGGRVDRQRSP
jgi:lipooligosaccharide transport system permease protein